MSVKPKELHSDAESVDCARPRCWLQRFHKNQRGTTLTEFLITLPIFIVIFVSMVRIGQFELTAGVVWETAYQDTWAKALPLSQAQVVAADSLHKHGNPNVAGGAASGQLAEHSTYNRIGGIKSVVTRLENRTYSGLQSSGHWGESMERVRPSAEYLNFDQVGSHLTGQPSTIIGSSSYAKGLVDDSGGTVTTPNGGSGVAAAVGAGVRYGTVFGKSEINPVIMGINIPMYIHFNTLVAPMPFTESTTTMEVARDVMLKQLHYRNILGISMSQPLGSGAGAVNVPTIRWDE